MRICAECRDLIKLSQQMFLELLKTIVFWDCCDENIRPGVGTARDSKNMLVMQNLFCCFFLFSGPLFKMDDLASRDVDKW